MAYLGSILAMGHNDEDHLKNTDNVLQRLSDLGLKLCEDKCNCFTSSVQYWVYCVDKERLHPLPKEVQDTVDAPTLKKLR